MRVWKTALDLLIVSSFIFLSDNVYAPVDEDYVAKQSLKCKLEYFDELREAYQAEQFNKFLSALGHRESSNNPESWNRLGYIGKYQFGRMARKSTGFEHVTYRDFKKDPSVWPEWEQDIAMQKLLMKNQMHLATVILQYDGKKMIDGVIVTKSGILAAAHIAGASGTKKYFNTNGRYNPKDAFGTSLEHYLLLFSGYNF